MNFSLKISNMRKSIEKKLLIVMEDNAVAENKKKSQETKRQNNHCTLFSFLHKFDGLLVCM